MTEYQYRKVVEALDPKLKPCSACGLENTWVLMDGYHLIQVHSEPRTSVAADSVIPTVILACKNCGLMQYHNVHVLGVSEVLGIPKPGDSF